ncbi:n-acetylglucosamine-1-phosphotransferase subunits alpha beta [Pelomyxa schiedti]|nr:n-acetylglucosamine-1-phosphotransferase subunits alpha beta [Pelomyxa schiedti]
MNRRGRGTQGLGRRTGNAGGGGGRSVQIVGLLVVGLVVVYMVVMTYYVFSGRGTETATTTTGVFDDADADALPGARTPFRTQIFKAPSKVPTKTMDGKTVVRIGPLARAEGKPDSPEPSPEFVDVKVKGTVIPPQREPAPLTEPKESDQTPTEPEEVESEETGEERHFTLRPQPPLNGPDYTSIDPSNKCQVVDVVYTWVNGSDPEFRKIKANWTSVSYFEGGFRDYGVLKYSMRSIEKFMPWARDIILVTNGQVPTWANISAPRFRVVTHEQIFKNKKNLPTFNSNAIEASIHNIPGLAPCLLYLNDDMFLGSNVTKDYFFDPETGIQNVFFSHTKAPAWNAMRTNKWHASVGFSNSLFNSYYNPTNLTLEHHYTGHNCYFMRQDVIDVMYHRWQKNFDFAETHKFRHRNDTAFPFLNMNVAFAEGVGQRPKFRNRAAFGTWKSNSTLNIEWWKGMVKNNPNAPDSIPCGKETKSALVCRRQIRTHFFPVL